MFCNQCGAENPDDSRFCAKCGAHFAAPQPYTPPAAAQQPAPPQVPPQPAPMQYPPAQPQPPQVPPQSVPAYGASYPVYFGTAFALDGLGFTRGGTVTIGNGMVGLSGRRHIPAWQRVIAWLLIAFVPVFIIGWCFPIVALVIVHYFCVTKAEQSFSLASLRNIKQQGRAVSYEVMTEGGNVRRSIFLARKADQAREIVALLAQQ